MLLRPELCLCLRTRPCGPHHKRLHHPRRPASPLPQVQRALLAGPGGAVHADAAVCGGHLCLPLAQATAGPPPGVRPPAPLCGPSCVCWRHRHHGGALAALGLGGVWPQAAAMLLNTVSACSEQWALGFRGCRACLGPSVHALHPPDQRAGLQGWLPLLPGARPCRLASRRRPPLCRPLSSRPACMPKSW